MIHLAIVGNGPVSEADKRLIASADSITRFNLVAEAHVDLTARTDEHFLACSSKQIGEYLAGRAYEDDPCFASAARIVLPYHPDIIASYMPGPSLLSRMKGRRADWTEVCRKAAESSGKELVVLSAEAYRDACHLLDIDSEDDAFYPSSGFMAVLRALRLCPLSTHEIHVFGFGFQGWKKHLWSAEEAFIRRLHRQGRVTLHTVPLAAGSSRGARLASGALRDTRAGDPA